MHFQVQILMVPEALHDEIMGLVRANRDRARSRLLTSLVTRRFNVPALLRPQRQKRRQAWSQP